MIPMLEQIYNSMGTDITASASDQNFLHKMNL
jgi:hypothetical protein